jgi:hypothetical protein
MRNKRSLTGKYPKYAVAYCFLHKCQLTVPELRKKRCREKECKHLYKYLKHPFWVQRCLKKAREEL